MNQSDLASIHRQIAATRVAMRVAEEDHLNVMNSFEYRLERLQRELDELHRRERAEGYDWADDAKKSYDEAIKAKRSLL